MKFLTVILIAIILHCGQLVKSQDVEANLKSEINKLLQYEVDIDSKDTPGCVIAVIDGDTSFVLSFGKKVGIDMPLDSSAYFDLGGLSKIYISIAANYFLVNQLIQADDLVEDIFPEFQNVPVGKVQFIQLLQHTSGIPRELKYVNVHKREKYQDLSMESLFGAFFDLNLKEATFEYSHYNYALLSLWMEKQSNKKFEDIISNILLDFPRIKADSIRMGSSKDFDRNLGLNTLRTPNKAITYGVMESNLGIQNKIETLIFLIMDFYLSDNPVAQAVLSNSIDTEIAKTIKFSQGLYIIADAKNYTVYSHSGRSNRHSAAIHFVPETRTGVVIFSNSETGTKDLSLQILRMINHNWSRKE